MKLQLAVLPAVSIATHVMGNVPLENDVPIGGLHRNVTSEQLSPNATIASRLKARGIAQVYWVKSEQDIQGDSVSSTLTKNEQELAFPAASLTEQFTVLTPLEKIAPGGGKQTGLLTFGQLSVTTGRE